MKTFITLLLALIFITSCKQNNNEEPTSDESFIISDSWIRPGTKNRNTAAFMKIVNNTDFDDTLFAVSSNLAKATEIHETFTAENDMMGMRHVDYVIIPKKSSMELKPGSFHIMLIGLNSDLDNGDSGKITLRFSKAGDVQLVSKISKK